MKEKVVEILLHIMAEIQGSKRLADIDMNELKDRGYTQSEITAAFSWLHDALKITDGTPAGPRAGARRILHDAEKHALSTESQGFLIHLQELGLLDERDVEAVIEKAMLTGYEKLTVSELHGIVAAVLFSKSGEAGGGRYLFTPGDTIH